jgi:hypothetical protein
MTRQGSFHSPNTIRTPLKAPQTFLPLGVGNDGGTETDRENGKGDKRINEGYQK